MKHNICAFFIIIIITIASVICINLECEYHYFRLGPTLGEQYCCHGLPRGGMNDPVVRNITGNHMVGRDNSHVIGFYIYHDKSMFFIPRGLKEFFPNMLGLAMLNCSIIRLEHDDLTGYNNLQALSLRQNYIERIPLGFYEHVPNLVETNMLENRISQVGPNILQPLVSLRSAGFERNICVDFNADSTTLHVLQNIFNTNCTYHGD